MSESRKINFSVNLDTSNVAQQAGSATKTIQSELAKQKQDIEKLLNDVANSGGKIKVPMEDFKAAINATKTALVDMSATNGQKIDELTLKLKQNQKLITDTNGKQWVMPSKNSDAIEKEISARKSLNREIEAQLTTLEQINVQYGKETQVTNQQTKATQGLTTQSRSLREEMRGIAIALAEMEANGQRGSKAYNQLRARGAQLTDAMGDARTQMRLLAHDNAGLQGVMDGLSGVSGAFTAATGAITLFGVQNEDLQKSMVRLQSVMSITMGLQQVLNTLNKDSAFRLGVLGKLQEWWTSCKAKAAVATTAETGAVVANTTAQVAQTTAIEAGTVANTAHAFSWKAVAIAIKSVPVFGWIVTGITALIGLVTLFTRKSKEEREELEKQKKALEELKKTQEEFRSSYASTASQLIMKYKEMREAWAKLRTEHEKKKFIKDRASDFNTLGKSVNGVKEAEDFLAGNTEKIVAAFKARAMALAAQEMQQNAYNKYLKRMIEIEQTVEGGGYYSYKKAGAYVPSINDALWEDYNAWVAERQAAEGENFSLRKYINADSKFTAEGEKSFKDYQSRQAKKRRQKNEAEALAEWEKVEDFTDREIKKQQAIIDAAGLKFEGGSGSGDGKDGKPDPNAVRKAMAELTDAEIRALRERNRQLIQLELERMQAIINIEKDISKQRAMQRQLDTEREQIQLQQQLEDQIDAEINRAKSLFEAQERVNKAKAEKEGKSYTEKQFNSGNLLTAGITADMTDQEIAALDTGDVSREAVNAIISYYKMMGTIADETRKQRLDRERDAQKLAMQEYLQDYGTYEEKKTAIAQIYAARRRNASSDAEKMRLTQEENQAYADLDLDDFMKTKASLAFGEIDNLSQETIADLIRQLEEYKGKITETFDPEKIEKYNAALAKLRKAQALGQGGVFGRLFTTDYAKERKAAQAELNALEKAHNDLLEKKAAKEQEVADRVQDIIDKVKELTGEELSPEEVKDGATVGGIIENLFAGGNEEGANQLNGMMDLLNGSRAELGGITEAADQAGVSFDNMGKQFAGAFEGSDGTLAAVEQIILKINQAVQEAAALLHDLADTADALGADTEVGSGWNQATTFMDGFAEASQSATDAFEAFKSGNPVGVIKGVVGSFTAWIRTFAAIHDNAREKKIQELQKEIEELDRINKRIEHRLEKQYSKDASRSYEQEIQNLEKQRALIQKQIAAEQDKKNTDDERIQEWKDQYEELGRQIDDYKDKALDAIIGEDINSSISNFADALADAWGSTAERAKATKDYVKSMLKQMVMEAMKTDLTGPITEMRQMMTDALADDVVTDAEKKELEKFAQDIGQFIQNRYSWADDIIQDSDRKQSGATNGGFATASQDSINELSGRAAAIHTSGEMRRELLMGIKVDMEGIREQIAQGQQANAEIRNLQLLAVGHLETIAKNTNELYEMNQRLDKIERNTRNL